MHVDNHNLGKKNFHSSFILRKFYISFPVLLFFIGLPIPCWMKVEILDTLSVSDFNVYLLKTHRQVCKNLVNTHYQIWKVWKN